MNTLSRFLLIFLASISSTALAGNLKVDLAPTQAVSAGAQWRVDGGVWRNSGVTVKNLTNASHTIEYKAVTGWVAPGPATVTLTNNVTTTITGTYVQSASLAVTLTPSTGQWRVDGGAWRNSGTSATGLTPGAHTISYNALANHIAPATETVTLVSGQTTNVARNYTATSNLTITLTPSNGSWQIDGGAWQPSGSTLSGLTPGAHTIGFSSISGMLPLASESISLPAAQGTSINRSYTAEAGLVVNLTPASAQWRVDGGAWQASGSRVGQLSAGNHTVDYNPALGYVAPASENVALVAGQTTTTNRNYTAVSAVTMNLTPSTASWQIDGGTWQASGATVTGLTPGNHTIAYSTVTGMLPMPSETVNLPGTETTSLARSYTAEAQLTVALTPSTASWQVDGGIWRASGATATGLRSGSHTISYSGLSAMIPPPAESITLVAGENASITRSHTPAGYIFVMLNPTTAQWRVDGGAWRASHTSTGLIAEGPHLLEYSSVEGKVTPAAETVTVVAGQNLQVSKFYGNEAFLVINLTPSTAQWRVDGGVWHNSGERVAQLSATGHTVEYSIVEGYAPLPTETVVLYSGQTTTLSRTYTLPPARLTVNLSDPNGWWQADSSGWRNSGQTISVGPGSHTISYLNTATALAPASETLTLQAKEEVTISRDYTPAGQVYVTLNPSTAQWRVDGGAWRTSSTYSGLIAAGTHTLEYSAVATKATPAAETINIVAGQNLTVGRAYQPESLLTIVLTPAAGQWRVDGGSWRNSGETVGQLTGGNHTVDYSSAAGYVAPATETVSLATGQTTTLTRSYTIPLTVNLSDPNGSWQAGNSGWRTSGQTIYLAPGDHTISYLDTVAGIAPGSETVTQQAGPAVTISRDYTPAGQVRVTLDPGTAQWRVDGGPWRTSATYSGLIAAGPHVLEYSNVAERITPTAETVNVVVGQTLQVSKVYVGEASLTLNLTPSSGQWRINGGAWHNSGDRVAQLTAGTHTVDYTSVDGYSVLPAETVLLDSGETKTLSRSYTLLPARLTVNLTDPTGQWRAGTSAWHNSGETISLAPGSHTISYLNSATALAPASETLTLQSNQEVTISRDYTPAGQVRVILNLTSAQWRVDGGTWRTAGTLSGLLAPGAHTLEYCPLAGKVTPPSETINIVAGQELTVSRTYAQEYFLKITLTPAVGQWRVDGGAWRNSGEQVGQLAEGSHSIEYSEVSGYLAPLAETTLITPYGGTNLARSYTRPSSLTVTVNPEGQWRIDNGPWQASGATLTGLRSAYYKIQFTSVPGYFDVAEEWIPLGENQNKSATYTHMPHGSVTTTLTPGSGTWRLNGGEWQASGATITALWASEYTIEYSPVDGMTAPPSEHFFLNLGEQKMISRSYGAPPSLTVTLTPEVGQWRVDGGAWQSSGSNIPNLVPGAHLIEYTDAQGYITPPAETFSLSNNQQANLTRVYRDASMGHLNVNVVPAHLAQIGVAKWRVDGGVWNASGETAEVSPGSHTLEFQPVDGLDVPAPTTVTATAGTIETLEATYYMPHRLRFFLHSDLVNGLPTAELQARLSQYAAHLQTIWERESLRRFVFNPATDISVVYASPFSGWTTPPLPEYGFEVWVYAHAAGTNTYGGGGFASVDSSGAAGPDGMQWTQIYDPSTLAPGSTELSEYWKQIDTMTRELERVFGAGLGGYDSARELPDLTSVAPLYSVDYFTAADPFWNAHSDVWGDPLLGTAWNNYRIGNPTALPALLDSVRFSATSRGIIDGCYRNAAWGYTQATLPDLSHVRVTVIDANTRQPVSGATLRMWHRPTPTGYPGSEEWAQPIGTPGTFEFSWMGTNTWSPFNNYDNAKLFKAYAPGYQPKAQWEWIYEAQRVKTVENSDVWEITVALDPAP